MELTARSKSSTAATRAVIRIQSPTAGLEANGSASKAKSLVEAAVLEEITKLGGNVLKHDGELLQE